VRDDFLHFAGPETEIGGYDSAMKSGQKMGAAESRSVKTALVKTWNLFSQSLPIILVVLMLISLVLTVIPARSLSALFTGNRFLDPLIGAITGSISSGNALTSYIISGELQHNGVSLLAVTAFIVSWVTVGIVQIPAEALTLGKTFAFARNAIAFVSSILVVILTVIILR
jgi:hypothetical protein